MTTWSGAMTPTGTTLSAVTRTVVSRHGHQRVEVPSREGVGEIAEVVAQERVHEREVGPQRGLK